MSADSPSSPRIFTYSQVIMEAIPQVEFHAFDHCGHIPHYEKPSEANPLLLEFLK